MIMGAFLSDLSSALAGTVQAASKSVVRVEGRRRLAASGIIWSADGIIVTADHVVRRDDGIGIGLPDGQKANAEVVGRDPTIDLAVLRVSVAELEGAQVGLSDKLQVGHLVLALGRPGQGIQATLGIVSALGEAWRTPAGGQLDRYLQTDVLMYPGFSGGPLVDASGRVLGMNTSAVLRGISLAIPGSDIESTVQALLDHGKVRRGFLGAALQPVRLPGQLAQETGQQTGLLVLSVTPDGPADQAGLVLGDTVVALDGNAVRHLDELMALLSSDIVGTAVPVRIVRGGQVQEISVVIGERP
jgi:S1-C subfamily serine protease